MKKLVLIAGGVVVANVVANAGLQLVRATGGSVSAMAFAVAPLFTPFPVAFRATMTEDAA